MNLFVFDIETVPDVAGARRIYNLMDLNDEDVVNVLTQKQLQAGRSQILPLHLQRVVSIAVALRHQDRFQVWSLGSEAATEKEIIERFFTGIARFQSTLVSWNGNGFDLPVLHYRALRHKVSAAQYWDMGKIDSASRWNNYVNRYHWKHIDLMDVLALYQARAYVSLEQMALLLGYPGKLGFNGQEVWPAFQQGNLKAIRDYCETDVLNTYLIYLRFLIFQGELEELEYEKEIALVREFLEQKQGESNLHWQHFYQNWREMEAQK